MEIAETAMYARGRGLGRRMGCCIWRLGLYGEGGGLGSPHGSALDKAGVLRRAWWKKVG